MPGGVRQTRKMYGNVYAQWAFHMGVFHPCWGYLPSYSVGHHPRPPLPCAGEGEVALQRT